MPKFTNLIPRISRIFGLLIVTCIVGGASAVYASDDPWERPNRGIFRFNDWTDRNVLRPTASAYSKVVPGFVRAGVGNVFDNVGTPATAINQILQGKPKASLSDLGRFLLNTTIGLGGIFDVASRVGLEKHEEDFGQTFGRWGAGSGNYVVLPFLGSSSVRDTVGLAFDSVLNPIRLISPAETRAGVVALSVIDLRADLLGIDELVIGDRYLFFRDAYDQRRSFLVTDGVSDDDDFDDDGFDEDEFDESDE